MRQYLIFLVLTLNCSVALVTCASFYSIIAPGNIHSNRPYTVVVSLHEADDPAIINVRVEGPLYYSAQDVHLQPYQTKAIEFELPKLGHGAHNLVAESTSGFKFRNESRLYSSGWANGARIYIQTDKAIYKPGDEVQFRIIMLDEHTRPLKIQEPILVEILDANRIRVKQFKDIRLVKGIYKGKFQLSAYPVLGHWRIKVTINGKYDENAEKFFKVEKYVLPKFSVYIKSDDSFIPEDHVLKSLVYGKYTFDRFVEGNLTATIQIFNGDVLREKMMIINSTTVLQFSFDKPNELMNVTSIDLRVELTEKHTGLTRMDSKTIQIRRQRYNINVDADSIQYRDNKPYRITAQVRYWNGSPVLDRQTPVIMQHGSKDYEAYLDGNGDAVFEFDHKSDDSHTFHFKNSTYKLPNIYVDDQMSTNDTETYCKLSLRGGRPRLGTKLEIEVRSSHDIPYLIYVIMGHANIVKSGHIRVPPNQKSYIIEITPTIEMIPNSYIYVHYIQNGHLRYDELMLSFPEIFKNQISIVAPQQLKPGGNVTIELQAQKKSYVGLLAVDLGVYLLDSSYDLDGGKIMNDLKNDISYTPTSAIVYPGVLSGALTLTNAHYRIAWPEPTGNSEHKKPHLGTNVDQIVPLKSIMVDNKFKQIRESNLLLKEDQHGRKPPNDPPLISDFNLVCNYLLNVWILPKEKVLEMNSIQFSYTPTSAIVYAGVLSGALSLTNAHYRIAWPEPTVHGGGFASAGFGGGAGRYKPPNFRNKFPETWIFENYEITNETTQLALTLPDSITTWRITAFSVNEDTGFGIVNRPTDIIARQAFFINLNLPYSVKRGELVNIPIIVFNYNDQSVETEITLYNEDVEFEFVHSMNSTDACDTEGQRRCKRLTVPENGVDKVEFLIKPQKVGDISLRVTAVNSISSDAVMRKLKVEPEGMVKHGNKPLYSGNPAGGTFASTIATDVPEDIVPESEYLTLSVGGDSLVPTLKNLNDLVLMPTGCGEQNMVNFAPNVLVLQYLKASGRYFKERALVRKAKQFIEIGYQQQLSYRHENGAYSVFGPNKDNEPSTWLTAYVIRFFLKASTYIPIEPRVIETGLEYLASKQLITGDFPFTGYLFYPAQQNRFGFTAFVLMTFLENQKHTIKYKRTVENGLAFLNTNYEKIKDIYALSIVANALQMAKHENAQKATGTLKMNGQRKDDHMWWSQNDKNREKDVEITAYVFMALLGIDNEPTDDLNILKWLIDQRNERGGFKSTHDTVVGLQALVSFSKKYNNMENMNLRIQYSAKNTQNEIVESNALTMGSNNFLILQTKELPRTTRAIDVNVTGSGYSLMQLSYHYHVNTDDKHKHFQIQPKPMMENADELHLEVCFTYREPNTTEQASSTNMIIMEANLPSGFTTNDEFSNDLLDNEIVQRIESQNAETKLVIYFKKITANVGNCLHIIAAKIHEVLERKPASIAVYDYYNKSRQNTVFYKI